MKTVGVYALTASDPRRGLFHSKLMMAAIILALLFTSLPAASALAAPARDSDITERNLEQSWKDKLGNLRWAGYYYDHVQFYPSDYERPADLARVQEYLEKYGIALRAANTILLNHAGFDLEGNVLNEVQADKSTRDLAMYLQIMRGLQDKINEIPHGKIKGR